MFLCIFSDIAINVSQLFGLKCQAMLSTKWAGFLLRINEWSGNTTTAVIWPCSTKWRKSALYDSPKGNYGTNLIPEQKDDVEWWAGSNYFWMEVMSQDRVCEEHNVICCDKPLLGRLISECVGKDVKPSLLQLIIVTFVLTVDRLDREPWLFVLTVDRLDWEPWLFVLTVDRLDREPWLFKFVLTVDRLDREPWFGNTQSVHPVTDVLVWWRQPL